MNFIHPQVEGFAGIAFKEWFKKEYGVFPVDLEKWKIEDQLEYFGKFFGYPIFTLTKLKIAVATYNNTIVSTNFVNSLYDDADNVRLNNGWIKIISDRDFPRENLKCAVFNIDSVKQNNRVVSRKTMWKWYKAGLITHYKYVLPLKHLPPIF